MTTSTTTDRPSPSPSSGHAAVTAFLADIVAGTGISPHHFAADATLDATVPGWRFNLVGAPAIAAEYSRWFHDPGVFESIVRLPIPGGEIVRYELAWSQDGVPHLGHHCHILMTGDEGLITGDTVFCGGRWSAALLAEMAAANR
jgi:hypothetical protein